MKIGKFFNRIISLFDSVVPKKIVCVRVAIFRFFRGLIDPQLIDESKITDFGSENENIFFGYYDITPFDENDRFLLCIKTPIIKRAPEEEDYAEIGYYRIDDPQAGFVALGKTSTWCWQQGCRLQWYGNKGSQIIYNCMIEGKYGSVIKKFPEGKIVKEINYPLYSISRDGEWGLSLDFSRLQRLRPGYGYGILPDKNIDNLKPNDDGIQLVNLKSNQTKQLFSLKNISEIEPHDSMEGAEHYFNHLMFNPSGDRFIFYHLWHKDGKKYSRIFAADRDGSRIKLLNNSGKSSHYNWISDNQIILYSFTKKMNGYSFAAINLDGEIRYFGDKIPSGDGHPTFIGKKIIVDTYPDLFRQRNLLCYDIKKDRVKTLARFNDFSDFNKEFRCDLHPRINDGKNKICVDRISGGRRIMSIIQYDLK